MDLMNHISEIYEIHENTDPALLDTNRIMLKIPDKFKRGIAYKKINSAENNALRLELESFIFSIQAIKTPTITVDDAIRALDLAFQIKKRIESDI